MTTKKHGIPTCECTDPGCPVHTSHNTCDIQSTIILYRIDMEDRTGIAFCGECADDALSSGVFTDGK